MLTHTSWAPLGGTLRAPSGHPPSRAVGGGSPLAAAHGPHLPPMATGFSAPLRSGAGGEGGGVLDRLEGGTRAPPVPPGYIAARDGSLAGAWHRFRREADRHRDLRPRGAAGRAAHPLDSPRRPLGDGGDRRDREPRGCWAAGAWRAGEPGRDAGAGGGAGAPIRRAAGGEDGAAAHLRRRVADQRRSGGTVAGRRDRSAAGARADRRPRGADRPAGRAGPGRGAGRPGAGGRGPWKKTRLDASSWSREPRRSAGFVPRGGPALRSETHGGPERWRRTGKRRRATPGVGPPPAMAATPAAPASGGGAAAAVSAWDASWRCCLPCPRPARSPMAVGSSSPTRATLAPRSLAKSLPAPAPPASSSSWGTQG